MKVVVTGLFKMFLCWILRIFNFQIQSERGHRCMQLMCHNKLKDLLEIYKWGCGPFCVLLLAISHLKGLSEA